MERQLPKNVRQIGNVSDSPKIYVEDYVDTFFIQLCEKCEKAGQGPIGAFLVGDIQKGSDDTYIYIYGAIQMHELRMEGNEYIIDDSTWRHAYEDCKQYFEEGEMLGWFVVNPGVPLTTDASIVKLHKKSFPKENTVFIIKDPGEKDEVYFVHKMNDLMEIGGHYTYYEKNPCMQNYMISSRKKNGAFPTETVEDRAAKDFRNMVRARGEHQKQRKSGGLMYVFSACLVLIVIIMGVSMMNSFDRMKAVQSSLESLTGSTDSVETQETSGTVTAVTGEEQMAQSEEPQEEIAGEEQNSQDLPETEPEESEVQTEETAESQPEETVEQNGEDGVYVVEKGDTLAIISKKMYGDVTHVDAICRMNGITDGNLIYEGQKLLLP